MIHIQQNYLIQSSSRYLNAFKQNDINRIIEERQKVAEHNKISSRNIMLASVIGLGTGSLTGYLCFKQKTKAGIICGLIGLLTGYLTGSATNTHINI